ncbi:hypothetical protein ACQRIU_001289 [Beauveria bassiana]
MPTEGPERCSLPQGWPAPAEPNDRTLRRGRFRKPWRQISYEQSRGQLNVKGLRMLLLDWITYHNLPVETVNAEPFQRRLLYGNLLLNSALLPSAKTLLRMLESEYAGAVGPVTEVLQNAGSQIHFSLDGWTSKSCTSFLGTNTQFVDRWDSDKRMMVRALTLRPVLNTFFNDVQNRWERESGSERTKSVVLEYRLSPYGWKVVEILVKLLKPFEVATKELQSSGMPGTRFTCGSLDEYFPVIKILLDHLENAIEGTVYEEIEDPGTKERKDIETAILDGLGSKTRAAYVGAIVFNPTKKWRLLDSLWSRVPSRKAKSWRQDYEHKLLQIWERYKDREVDCEVVPMPEDVSMDYIERRLARSIA